MTDSTSRLARARVALEGLAVGDALGGFFEFAGANARRRIAERWRAQPSRGSRLKAATTRAARASLNSLR